MTAQTPEKHLPVGPLVQLPTEEIVEIIGLSGFDFVLIDLEHGAVSIDRLAGLVRAAEAVSLTPWVRVPGLDEGVISRVLELGVPRLWFPRLESHDDVNEAVALTRFGPVGKRGVCNGARAASYGMDRDRGPLPEEPPEVIIVIETEELLAELSECVNTDGVTGVIVGVYDLAAAMGAPNPTDPRVREAVSRAARETNDAGKEFGYYARRPEQMQEALQFGAAFALCGVDVYTVSDAFRGLASEVRESEQTALAAQGQQNPVRV